MPDPTFTNEWGIDVRKITPGIIVKLTNPLTNTTKLAAVMSLRPSGFGTAHVADVGMVDFHVRAVSAIVR